jgi:hypothetical protein
MKPTWEGFCRLVLLALATGSTAGCSTTNSNFCTESAIVPPSKFGTCNPTEMGLPLIDAGLVVIDFPDLAGCESANAASCSNEDRTVITNNISCFNGAISKAPACKSGQELTWVNDYVDAPCMGNGSPSSTCSQAVGLSPP